MLCTCVVVSYLIGPIFVKPFYFRLLILMLEWHGESPWSLGLEFTMNPVIVNSHITSNVCPCCFVKLVKQHFDSYKCCMITNKTSTVSYRLPHFCTLQYICIYFKHTEWWHMDIDRCIRWTENFQWETCLSDSC